MKMMGPRAFIAIAIMIILPGISTGSGVGSWWKVYFTTPGSASRQGPEKGLVTLLQQADKSFFGAFYELDAPVIIREMDRAHERGVDVRLVMDSDNATHNGLEPLRKCGIEIVTDNRPGFMHNKFAIIDGKQVWTGSYNATNNGSMKNFNNAILINSERLAEIFTDEFMEMHRDKVFGNKRDPGPFAEIRNRYHVKIDDTDINVYFSPENGIERILLKRLAKARRSIHFLAFSLTSDLIGEIIIKKHKEGVKVYGVFEGRGARTKYSEYIKMKIEGVPVKLDGSRYTMHHKVIIIDGHIVITGSYNFSRNADKKNDENILIIDNEAIAGEYLREFERIYR